MKYELLGEIEIYRQGSFRIVERYYHGWNKELNGTYIFGWTGKETRVRESVIEPLSILYVKK